MKRAMWKREDEAVEFQRDQQRGHLCLGDTDQLGKANRTYLTRVF